MIPLRDRVRAWLPAVLVPDPPCGALSPKLPATFTDLRSLGVLGPFEKGRRSPRPPKHWHRVCVCSLGHAGEWHRSEDGQVWHRDDSVTREELAEKQRQEQLLAEEVRKFQSTVRFYEETT